MTSNHGNLENIVLNAIWNIEENKEELRMADVSTVKKVINDNNEQSWAYTTVKTVLDRLSEKKLLRKTKQNRKYLYFSVLSREEMGQKAIEKLIMQYYKNDIDLFLNAVKTFQEDELMIV